MKYLARTFAAAAAVVTMTACSPDVQERPMDTAAAKAQQFNQLMQRPDINQATARYEEMYGKVRQALSAAFPQLKWQQSDEAGGAACGPDFAAVDAGARQDDAVIKGLANWSASDKIPDSGWAQAVSIVDGIVHSYGFDSGPVVVKSQPSDHYVTFHDAYQAKLTLGTSVNTGMTLITGCHLTAEAKKRGTPAPTPTY